MDTVPIVYRAIGYKTAPENIPALKYGREMEGVARRAYKVALESIGMWLSMLRRLGVVHPDKGYLGARPDLIITMSVVITDYCGHRFVQRPIQQSFGLVKCLVGLAKIWMRYVQKYSWNIDMKIPLQMLWLNWPTWLIWKNSPFVFWYLIIKFICA